MSTKTKEDKKIEQISKEIEEKKAAYRAHKKVREQYPAHHGKKSRYLK